MLGLRVVDGVADLAKDLAFAQHRRVDPCGNLEQVSNRGIVVPADEIPAEIDDSASGGRRLLSGHKSMRSEQAVPDAGSHPGLDVRQPVVESLDDGVDLGPHAGGENYGFAQVGAVRELIQDLRQVAVGDSELLEQLEGGIALMYTDYDYCH